MQFFSKVPHTERYWVNACRAFPTIANDRDRIVHVFRNGTPLFDPRYLDRWPRKALIPPTDRGNPIRGSESSQAFNCIEVIITLPGVNPMPMVALNEVKQSPHIAYFRFLYRAIRSFFHFFVEFLRTSERWSTEY
jgi:hypothetical protein